MKLKFYHFAILFALALLQSCGNTQKETVQEDYGNPASEGFNLEGSDPKAIEIADEVMEAMGGRKAWDNTRHIAWNFFGVRDLVWDKWTGDVRIDHDKTVYLININDNSGKVYIDGREITDSDSLSNLINRGKGAWINDSYWLLMPFKLKDSGVTLKYMGEEPTNEGVESDKLELTFENVGNTPNNRYWVWVSQTDHLVNQWAYYSNSADNAQVFNRPFKDYQRKGEILISGDRGDRKLTNIQVYKELPESVYHSPEKPDWASISSK